MSKIEIDRRNVPSAREARLPFSDNAATFLSSEQFSLGSARALLWNESFNRAAIFLTTLSASAVALALVADASGFGGQFTVFAFVLFPIVLFLGIATHARLVQISLEDVHLVLALNRLRRAYIENAPEIRDYFTAGISDDEIGVWATYLMGRPQPRRHWQQVLVNMPTVVATLNAVIATTGIGGLVTYFGGTRLIVLVVCAGTFLTISAGLFSLQLRAFKTARRHEPRYPSED
jgi:hypothetical protein